MFAETASVIGRYIELKKPVGVADQCLLPVMEQVNPGRQLHEMIELFNSGPQLPGSQAELPFVSGGGGKKELT